MSHKCVLDVSHNVACCWWQTHFICTINCFVSSQMHCLLTSTGYGPRSCSVLVLGKSAMISEVVCVALFVCFKGSFLTGYDCIRLYFSAAVHR